MPKTQERTEQRERTELRRLRKEQGVCIECGKGEPVGNTGGDFVLRCEPCLEGYRAGRKKHQPRSRFNVPPKRTYDPDYDFFDTKFWKRFVREVEMFVPRKRAITQRLIKARFRDRYEQDFLDRYTGIALSQIESTGRIRATWGIPTKYTRSEPVVYSLVTGMAIRQARSVQPDNASIYSERV